MHNAAFFKANKMIEKNDSLIDSYKLAYNNSKVPPLILNYGNATVHKYHTGVDTAA